MNRLILHDIKNQATNANKSSKVLFQLLML